MNNLSTKSSLLKKNLILVDVKCMNVSSVSENCLEKESYLIYSCKKGYKFDNNRGGLFKYKR